ncbi:CLOCK-interacting pacemaker a [Stigmatopora nigra]
MSSISQLVQHSTSSLTSVKHYGVSKQDSERDSGFSDASSEYLGAVDGTDSEDAGRKRATVAQDGSGLQLALMGGSYAGLSPMLIMNNFVVNQPSQNDTQWRFPSSLDAMPQSQMVLLQPMISPKATIENIPHSKGHKSTLKSYPRIAPNYVETLSKKPGSSRKRHHSSSTYGKRHRSHQQGNRQHSTSVSEWTSQEISSNHSSLPTDSSEPFNEKCLSSVTGSTSQSPSNYEARTELEENQLCPDISTDGLLAGSEKLKRFSNTYNILSNCGLLGITMRTKQLIKENKRTQSQLQLLQEHTALLLEALGSGDPHLWTKLQLSLQDYNK